MTLADTSPIPPNIAMVEGSEHGGVRHEITREQWEKQ